MVQAYIRVTLFLCLISTGLFSQEHDATIGLPNDLDQLYIPGKNSILNSVNSISTGGPRESKPVKNAIKFNVTLLTRSAMAFFWEHPVSKITSFEAGLGATYGVDYMQRTFGEMGDAFAGSTNSNGTVKLSSLLQNSSYAGSPGPFLSGGVKFYFSNDAPDGTYFSFSIRYSKYNLTYDQRNGFPISGSPDFALKNLCFLFTSGHQVISTSLGNGSFVQDLYMSVGIRRVAYTGFAVPSSNSSYPNQSSYTNTGMDLTQMQPVILFGYTLGFGF